MTSDNLGHVAIVTGASGAIGGALCIALGTRDVVVCAVGRDHSRLEQRFKGAAGDIRCFETDLSNGDEVADLVARVDSDVGSVDLLIHCAGVIELGETAYASIEGFDRQYQINLRAPYLLTQLVLPGLIERKGNVVFINSSAGLVARRNVGQYAATKHGLKAVADSLREEVNPAGVKVLSVFPGRTAGPMQANLHEKERRDYVPEALVQPEDIAAVVLDALALPRTAEVTDIHVRPMRPPS